MIKVLSLSVVRTERKIFTDRNIATHTNSETPILTKKIGKTTYIVGIHFDGKAKERLENKMQRMLIAEVTES